MAKRKATRWRTDDLAPIDISLDRQNPRINVEKNDKESDIIKKLVQYEEIIDLARKLAKSGLLPGERVIVVKENSHYVVLEGNRRICACKLLLSPSLVPTDFRKNFPKLDAAGIARIQTVAVDVAPDRRSAEHILTLRHTEPGIRKWKPVARMRRVKRLLDEGFSIDEIANEYNASTSNIRKTIREFQLLQLAEDLKGLTQSERRALENPDLKTNPYTRFFELSGVKEFLGLSFDAAGSPIIKGSRRAFDENLKRIVRSLLIADADADYDTRSRPGEILGRPYDKFETARQKAAGRAPTNGKGKKSTSSGGSKGSRPGHHAPDKFFESLTCQIKDNAIRSVVNEIRKLDPDRYPISGTYLLRTLIELCLRHMIAKANKKVPGTSDPTLSELVKFVLNDRSIFPNKRLGDVIEAARNQKSFDYLNIVVHQKWMNADPTTLRSVANQLRNFITHTVQGS